MANGNRKWWSTLEKVDDDKIIGFSDLVYQGSRLGTMTEDDLPHLRQLERYVRTESEDRRARRSWWIETSEDGSGYWPEDRGL